MMGVEKVREKSTGSKRRKKSEYDKTGKVSIT